jgi:hypothetical protein
MRKICTSILLLAICLTEVQAQIANGFYYVKNAYTNRYLCIRDNAPSHYRINTAAGGAATLKGIKVIKSWDKVRTSPSCVIYVRNISGNNYDLEGQGSSLYTLSGNKLYATLTPNGDGSYKATGHYKVTVTIDDGSTNLNTEEVSLKTAFNKQCSNWIPVPVNTGENYLGIKPDVQADGGYYGTIFASFAFKLASSGMKAYYISEASGSKITLKEISGTIPAATPVIIRCSSNDPSKNKIEPVTSGGTTISANKLGGVYCYIEDGTYINTTMYDPTKMRILGSDNGKIAFVKASASDLENSKFLKANKAYLTVPSGSADIMTESGTGITTINTEAVSKDKEGLFTLTGLRIPDNVTPQPGIYIKNGKKIVIK